MDVVIVTAVKEEYDAVLQVKAGTWPGNEWEQRPGPMGLEVAFRTFKTKGGQRLRVVVTRALDMGGVEAVNAAGPVVQKYAPQCVAMCGVCAGWEKTVRLGDVIAADLLWDYEAGKVERTRTGSGRRVERVKGRGTTHLIDAVWKQRAESFQPPADSEWLEEHPRTYEDQMDWVLERLLKGEAPATHPDRKKRCRDYPQVMERLRAAKWLRKNEVSLTEKGRRYIQRKLDDHPDGLPEREPFKVRVGAIASGSKVVKDEDIFEKLSEKEYKVLGLEMEAAAIGALARLHKTQYMLVMKGVMDFANLGKNDNFKDFAARASAECLLAFLRENLEPGPGDAFEDVLDTGMAEPREDLSPAGLLNARYRVVPFTHRDEELKELRAWCESPEPVRARLFHGAGGMGKTRLFVEWSARLRREGWVAGFLFNPVKNPERFEALLEDERDALVVIDYAESRPDLVSWLELMARRKNAGSGKHLRVVLLARAVGGWWESLLGSEVRIKELFGQDDVREVRPLAENGEARHAVFQAAVKHLRAQREYPEGELPVVTLEDERFQRVLYLHMAALATVDGWSLHVEDLMKEVLEHEERFWRTRVRPEVPTDAAWRLFLKKARCAVAALTLVGGARKQDAEELLAEVNGARDESLLLMLADMYPGRRREAESTDVSGLEPDLLGEAMVVRALKQEADGGAGLLGRIFRTAGQSVLRTGFEVMGRISSDHRVEAVRWIAWMLEEDVAGRAVPALEAAKAIGERTAHSILGRELARALEAEGTVKEAWQVFVAGIPERTVSLSEVALWVTQTLLRILPTSEAEGVMVARANMLNDVGLSHSSLGRREEALEVTREVVEILRRLAQESPHAFLPALAASLNNLGKMQGELGRREEALESTREALEIGRRLAQAHPQAFLPYLAASLHNLGCAQSEYGRREEALESTRESVETHRRLAQEHPEAFLPHLAASLHNLGRMYSSLERREEALESTQQAVDMSRRLAQARPDAFLPDLARGLNSLGLMQRKLGRSEEAMKSTREAVEHYRRLAQARPDAFLPGLAAGLDNLGNIQNELGRSEEAMKSTREAVEHYRRLTQTCSDAFLPGLAPSLNSLGKMYCALGRMEDALEATHEAVANYRRLAQERPEAFLPDLAGNLHNLGNIQSELARSQEALESTWEAVEIRRRLAQVRPDAFLPDLAASLNKLGALQSELGRREEALESTGEALDAIWPLFEKIPAAFAGTTARILQNMASRLEELSQPPPAELVARMTTFLSRRGAWPETEEAQQPSDKSPSKG